MGTFITKLHLEKQARENIGRFRSPSAGVAIWKVKGQLCGGGRVRVPSLGQAPVSGSHSCATLETAKDHRSASGVVTCAKLIQTENQPRGWQSVAAGHHEHNLSQRACVHPEHLNRECLALDCLMP